MIDLTLEIKFTVQRSEENPDVMTVEFTDLYGETHKVDEWNFVKESRYELVVDLVADETEYKTLEREDD
jgi:hypothetical protein